MNRRYFLKGLGAGTSSLGLPASASTAKSCKVIGVGAAGWNFVQFAWRSSTLLKSDEWGIDFICVDSDPHVLKEVADENATKPGQVSINRDCPLEIFKPF